MACLLLLLCVETQLGESGQGANLSSMVPRASAPDPDARLIMKIVMRPLKDPIFIRPPFPRAGFNPSLAFSLVGPVRQFRWGMAQTLDPSLREGLDPICRPEQCA